MRTRRNGRPHPAIVAALTLALVMPACAPQDVTSLLGSETAVEATATEDASTATDSTAAGGTSTSSSSSATSATTQAKEKQPADDWETDIRMSIATEKDLMKASGKKLDAWDKAVDEAKQAGLKDPITVEALRKADKDATVLLENDKVYFIGASSLFGKVSDALDAYRLAYRLMGALGGSPDTYVCLMARLTKDDVTVYNFQQISDGQTVIGGTMKIAVDKAGQVTAVFSSIDSEADHTEMVSRKEAEALAAEHCEGDDKVQADLTERSVIASVDIAAILDLDHPINEPVPDDYVWVVYSTNGDAETKKDYPYLAHYVRVDGTWLYSLPVAEPGNASARSGVDTPDVFVGMTADSYTCEVTDVAGYKRTITVPTMKSEADGCWYLGDVEARVAVADFYEVAYGDDHDVVLVKSENNTDWDVEDIYTYYNYLRARDFYTKMGWIGPDGQNSDEIILKGLCFSDRTAYENACSIGKLGGFEAFGYAPYSTDGTPLRLGWGLDVLAHEYTHAFTGITMGQNLYQNDLGAINEAMSDIMGNLVEYIYADTDDAAWTLGENTGNPIRSMSDPHAYDQPEYVWDQYYGPETDEPNEANDQGGVHVKSSLLNMICAKLCTEHGMSYDEAVSFWMTVAMGMVPQADYTQMRALLTWALEQAGLSDKYQKALDELVDETRIDTHDRPETLPAGQKMVELVLPDTETFKDEHWTLFCYQVDIEPLVQMVTGAMDMIGQAMEDPDGLDKLAEGFGEMLGELQLEDLETGPSFLLDGEGDTEGTDEDDPTQLISDLFGDLVKDNVHLSQSATWEEMDTGVMSFVVEDEIPTLYLLMNISEGGAAVNNILVKLGDKWYDLTAIADPDMTEEELDAQVSEMSEALVNEVLTYFPPMDDASGLPGGTATGSDATSSNVTSAETDTVVVERLPTAGLEDVEIGTAMRLADMV